METAAKNTVGPEPGTVSAESQAIQTNLPDPNLCGTALSPSARVYEDDEAYEIDIPALPPGEEAFTVEVKNRVLTISAQNTEGKNDNTSIKGKFSFGSFKFSFTLSCDVIEDDIITAYGDGIFRIIVPKVRRFLSSLRTWKKGEGGGYLSRATSLNF